MFGFVTIAPELLGDDERQRYRAWYCGLCRALGDIGGHSCRLLLTYDTVFLVMLLSSALSLPETQTDRRCAVHPFHPHAELRTAATDYAAAMNVLLFRDKLLDDWQDDRSFPALTAAAFYRGKCAALAAQYPRQAQVIESELQTLHQYEHDGETNPDLPANAFGRLTGEIFVMHDDGSDLAHRLRQFGESLGKFIYLMDAATDLRDDLRRERYNPLASLPSEDIPALLELIGGETLRRFDSLPLTADRHLMEHILCAGIWGNYAARMNQIHQKGKGKETHGKQSL